MGVGYPTSCPYFSSTSQRWVVGRGPEWRVCQAVQATCVVFSFEEETAFAVA